MTTLLIHPADEPETGPWSDKKWSRVIDLGLGGATAYERWGRVFGCPVIPIDSMRRGLDEAYRVRDLIAKGLGRLVDSDGVDWWEMMSTRLPGPLDSMVMLRRLVESLDRDEEVHITRAGFHATALRCVLGERLHILEPAVAGNRGLIRYFAAARRFPARQLLQIFWDKYDPALDVRRHFARRPRTSDAPVVLIPSAYVNVTRTGLEYARIAPGLRFLLVAARANAWADSIPPNVRGEWLASYASGREEGPGEDYDSILKSWPQLRKELESEPEMDSLSKAGLLDDFPDYFRVGWKVRAAWEAVFRREKIQALLCCDDSNIFTRLALLVAKQRGVPTVACHHGALDGQRIFKRNAADKVLAKGEMERDYLVRVCGIPEAEVVMGAPVAVTDRSQQAEGRPRERGGITFFSEPYESFGARGKEFYRDILPPLAALAREMERKLIVKLHPAESSSERRRMIDTILPPYQRQIVSLVTGSTTSELLRQTWFGVTVLSTVATECAAAGVPCFLCRWLEFAHQGYMEQFLRFGVAHELKAPTDIANIPRMLEAHSLDSRVRSAVSQSIDPRRLEDLLSSRHATASGRRGDAKGTMNQGTLLIRADASVAIGTGHVMRCLALGQAWQDAGGTATFAMAESTPAIRQRLSEEGFGLVQVEGAGTGKMEVGCTADLAKSAGASWAVLDGYHLDARYQESLRNAGFKVLLIDDNGQQGCTADVVLNQNIHAHENLYAECAGHARLLLGTKYALLRREFASAVGHRREIPDVAHKILVVMGGSDPDNVTLRVIQVMEQIDVRGLELSVIVGGSNPYLQSITAVAARSRHECRILQNVTEMNKLIAWADLAISAAGSACWEYCALGLPAAVVAVAENQGPAAEALDSAGAARLVRGGSQFDTVEMAQFVTRLANSRDERMSMSRIGQTLVDGRGASRVVSILLSEGSVR